MAKSIAEKLKDAGVDASRGTITWIDPEALTLIRDKKHPLYDPRVDMPLEEGKVVDLMMRGVLQAISCRDNGVLAGKPIIQVIAGRRRTLHLREANKRLREAGQPVRKMPVTFVHGGDAEMMLLAISENAHREGETVGSLAWKVSTCCTLGCSLEEVAAACGMSKKRVESLLKYRSLLPSVQKEFDAGRLPVTAIDVVAEVPREEQERFVGEMQMAGVTKTHEIKDAVKAHANGNTIKAGDRKKLWSRGNWNAFQKALENGPKNKETIVGRAMVDFVLGDDKALDEFESLKAAAAMVRKQLKKAANAKL